MNDDKYGVEDLVINALTNKPLEFETAFNDLIVDRIHSAIESKKIEVAKTMYGYNPEEQTDFESEQEEPDLEDQEYGEES